MMGQEFGVATHKTDTNTEEDSLMEAVTKYAERATRAESNMAEMEAKFEERFAMLSITLQQLQDYTPTPPQYPTNTHPMQTEYFTTPPPTFIPPPAAIHVPAPQQLPIYQQQYNAGKKRRKGQGTRSQGGGTNNYWKRDQPHGANQQPYGGGGRGGGIPANPNYYQQPHGGGGRGATTNQWNHCGGARGSGNNQCHQGGGVQRGATRQPYSNTRKLNLNLLYCYSCRYDVDHAVWQCQYKKTTHILNMPCDEAHTVAGASMKA